MASELLKITISKRNLYETAAILLLGDLLWMYNGFCELQLVIGITIIVILLVVPRLFTPLAWILIFSGGILSKIVPPLLFTFIFYLLVSPVGIAQRLRKKDSQILSGLKKTEESLFIERNKLFEKEDLIHPY